MSSKKPLPANPSSKKPLPPHPPTISVKKPPPVRQHFTPKPPSSNPTSSSNPPAVPQRTFSLKHSPSAEKNPHAAAIPKGGRRVLPSPSSFPKTEADQPVTAADPPMNLSQSEDNLSRFRSQTTSAVAPSRNRKPLPNPRPFSTMGFGLQPRNTRHLEKKIQKAKDEQIRHVEQSQCALFDFVVVVTLFEKDQCRTASISYQFPPVDRPDEDTTRMLNMLPMFCFPDRDTWQAKNSNMGMKETFSFVLTELDGSRRYG